MFLLFEGGLNQAFEAREGNWVLAFEIEEVYEHQVPLTAQLTLV